MTTYAFVVVLFLVLTSFTFILTTLRLADKLEETEAELENVKRDLKNATASDEWVIDRPYGR